MVSGPFSGTWDEGRETGGSGGMEGAGRGVIGATAAGATSFMTGGALFATSVGERCAAKPSGPSSSSCARRPASFACRSASGSSP